MYSGRLSMIIDYFPQNAAKSLKTSFAKLLHTFFVVHDFKKMIVCFVLISVWNKKGARDDSVMYCRR